jgi:FAD/FMN-containing dehydrogenase
VPPDTAESALVEALHRILPADAVRTDDDAVAYFAADALGPQRGFVDDIPAMPPLVVVEPSTIEELASVLRAANAAGIPITPYGAGTGLMGGARSLRRGIVLSSARLNRIREIDAESGWIWAEAGCVLSDVDRALQPHNLALGHDPWTFSVATVGGAISTNGLGFLGGKYGSMGQQVLAVEAVLADGTIVRTRPPRPHSTGIDLNHLVIAGEGTLAVIAAAALRAFPRPEAFALRGYRFDTFAAGFDAILAMQGIGLAPAVLDFGDHPDHAGDAHDATATLYLGFAGFDEEVQAQLQRAAKICADAPTVNEPEVDEFWTTRHEIADRFARSRSRGERRSRPGGDNACFDYIHLALPASRVVSYRDQALAIARNHNVRVIETGLWVSSALFSITMMCAAATREESIERMSATVDACIRAAHAIGGSMEYCHGAGIRLASFMQEEHGAGLDVMRKIKRALDPHNILNPGKLALDEPESP